MAYTSLFVRYELNEFQVWRGGKEVNRFSDFVDLLNHYAADGYEYVNTVTLRSSLFSVDQFDPNKITKMEPAEMLVIFKGPEDL